MNNPSGVGGVIPVVAMFDYLQPDINRPDLFTQRAYPLVGGGGGGSAALRSIQRNKSTGDVTIEKYRPGDENSTLYSIQRHKSSGTERSPIATVYYTLGLIVVSAAIFLSLAAWSNVLLSWYDGIYVSHVVDPVTKSRLYFAITITIIAMIVITLLLLIWYYFTIQRGK